MQKNLYFLLKKLFNAGTGMRRGYPKSSGMGMRFNFSSPLSMGRVTGKYLRIGYGDGEGKTHDGASYIFSDQNNCLAFYD